jgi:tetratricopeptide (TPR) repeat protein
VPTQPRILLLYDLLCWYLLDSQYERSLEIAKRLESLAIPKSMRIDVKRRKSECFDALGMAQESAAEIKSAQANSVGNSNDRYNLVAQGTLMSNQKRYADAYSLFSRAIELTPKSAGREREITLGHLMTMAHLSGRSSEILPWARMLLQESKQPQFLCIAYRMAAVACNETNDLSGAEEYSRAGADYARRMKRPTDLSNLLSYCATLAMRRQNPEAALPLFDEAIAADPSNAYQAYLTKGETLYAMGRFADGIHSISQGRRCINVPLPSGRKKLDALLVLAIARGYNLLGDSEAAVRNIDQAVPYLTDQKMTIWCNAAYAWAYANGNRREEAESKISLVHSKRKLLPDDESFQRTCLSHTARAALRLGDIENAQKYANEYISSSPKPSDMPFANFLLAECAREIGDTQKARIFYETAANMKWALYYSKLSQERLASMPS